MNAIQQRFSVSYSYPILFTHDVFDEQNQSLVRIVKKSGQACSRVLFVVDSGVVRATPGLQGKIKGYVCRHADRLEMVAPPLIMKGGEDCKKDPNEAARVTAMIERHHLCRHSFVVAIGGGAVLDATGFAAGIAHRGVRLIRIPTTTLAQNDAGVGVKNSINAFGRKNFLGTFTPPFAVINDSSFLKTLPQRLLRAGIAEAVKVALIRDKTFFRFLYRNRRALAAFEPQILEKTVFHCAKVHLHHIRTSGDPFEFGSSRPLDFGHWSAHKLEEMSNGRLNHGEAVAIGMALDALYSHYAGYLQEEDLTKILSTLEDLGFALYHPDLEQLNIEKALREFQEHMGGKLTIPLIRGIGEKMEAHKIRTSLMKQGIRTLAVKERGGKE